MANDVVIPRLGWSMEEGVFAGWLKQPGEAVAAGEPLFMLEGEKATQEIEAVDGGILHVAPDAPAVGQTVLVGRLIAKLGRPGEAPDWSPAAIRGASGVENGPSTTVDRTPTAEPGRPPERSVGEAPSPRPRSSPRARRAAWDAGVEIGTVRGSGVRGRVRERDVLAAAEAGSTLVPPPHGADAGPTVPISATRRAIARLMVTSRQQTVPVTLTAWADAASLLAARAAGKAAAGPDSPAVHDMLLKALADSILAHPLLAARWDETQLTLPGERIDIGLAVDAADGLVVPVVRDVAAAPLVEVARQTRSLVARARTGQLVAADMQGGVFTLTSLGALGVEFFTPVINYPQGAILGVGTVRMQPVPAAGEPGFRLQPQLPLSLTFDHRVVDGAPAARFLADLAGRIAAFDPAPDGG
ncbi:MAG: 2-oxo acid dehydrogenase subunit E2 [Planctomycetes bacterium]|nr:2-oxo acid dehydrogenase subunit E2 [Planctomycetota bacterium]